jgi:hypothetical protein
MAHHWPDRGGPSLEGTDNRDETDISRELLVEITTNTNVGASGQVRDGSTFQMTVSSMTSLLWTSLSCERRAKQNSIRSSKPTLRL